MLLVHLLKCILDLIHSLGHKKLQMDGIIDFKRLRPAEMVDADSSETTNTPKGVAPAADPVLSMYVGQLNPSRLEVASMNTNSDACRTCLWARAIMGLHIAKIRGFLLHVIIFSDVLLLLASSSCMV